MLKKVTGARSRWLWLLLLLMGLGWLLPTPGHSAAQQTVTLEAYLSAITHYRSQIRSAANNTAQCQETLTAVANALNAITAVQFPDGSVMRVDHQGATQALQSRPCNPARADQYLSGLCPNQLCAVANPLPPMRTAPDNQNNDSLAEAAGANSDNAAAASNSPPPTMPPASAPPPNAPTVETNLPAEQNAPGDEAGTPAATAPPTIEPPAEAVPNEGTADGQEAANGEQTGLTTKEPAEATGEPAEGAAGEQTRESANESADQTGVAPGTEDASETAAAQSTPQATPTATNTPPTPTAVPNPPAAAATPDTPKSAATQNRWILLAVIVAALALIGTAVALLLWPGKEEEEPEEEKEQRKVATAVQEGRQLVEKGDYREAARQLFLAMLLALDEKGILRFDRNRTNRELLQQERLHKEIVPSLVPIIATYERVWYGLEPLPAAEYERLVNEIKAIRDWQVGT